MGRWLLLGLSALLSGAVGQNQYRPEGGAADGGASARGGSRGQESGTGAEGSLEETIPGIPGDDYPIFAEVPDTSFVCDGLVEGGYYADVEAECQVFHICGNDGNGGLTKYSFLCPNGTIFQQQYFVCDWWFNVDCSLAEELYSLNDIVAAEREANTGAGETFGAKINSDEAGKEMKGREEVRGEGTSPGTEGTSKPSSSQPEYGGGSRKRVASSRKKARGGRRSRPSQKQRGVNRKSSRRGSRSEESSLSRYGGGGSNTAGTGSGLTGGYEPIGSPGFGGEGSFGPDGLFSADYGPDAGPELGKYNREARDIMVTDWEDYINLQDYSL